MWDVRNGNKQHGLRNGVGEWEWTGPADSLVTYVYRCLSEELQFPCKQEGEKCKEKTTNWSLMKWFLHNLDNNIDGMGVETKLCELKAEASMGGMGKRNNSKEWEEELQWRQW